MKRLKTLFLLLIGIGTSVFAQTAVTVGSQVTNVSNIVSGKAYILQSQAAGTGTLPYINDNGTNYDIPMSNNCTEASVYYLISNGDGTWKIKNYYTGHFWGVPVYNQALASVADETLAGSWSLNFSNGIAYPSAPDSENTVRGLDRSSNKLWGFTTGTGGTKQVKIYEVGPTEKGLTTPVNIVSGWYLVKWVDTNSDTNTNYSDSDVNGKYVKNYTQDVTVNSNNYSLYLDDAPTETDGIALSLIYFEKDGSDSGRGVDGYLRSANGHYITQTGSTSNSQTNKNYIIYRSSSTPNYSTITSGYTGNRNSLIPCGKDATPYIGQSAQNKFPVAQFYSIDFSLYNIQPWRVEFDGEENAQVTYTGSNIYGLKSVYNGGTFFFANGITPTANDFSAPSRLGLSPDVEVNATNHTINIKYNDYDIHDVYTINNTNTNRGALIYNPENPKYVWSSGKSGTFNASQANSQWVICPTGTDGQYYLYNVGAGKFAIPTGIAQSASNSWVFSDNAVAVIFETQSDGTKKIKMATNPVSGTNAAYMAVSNGYTGPIINYNDAGSNFILTKVDGVDQSAAATAAVNKLIGSQTPLTSYPQASGWYAIQIKSKNGSPTYAGRFLQSSETLYNGLYPLTFTGAIDVNPAVTDPTFLTYINHTDWDVNTWQMPDGRYLVKNSSSKFPTPSATPGNVMCGFDNGNYFKVDGNWFADPYNSNATYFVGETTTMRTAYNVYPVDLAAAGMEAWQVVCDAAPESALINCSRSDLKGASSVYKGGFFFLPAGVTPESTDFTLEGASGVTVDATAKTITFAYDPNLAMVEGSITTAQGWQTAGRGGEVMLLKVDAAPFKDATNVSLSVNMKDGSEANISKLTLYEASTNSPEIYSTGTGAPTKTQIDQVTVSGSTATFNIGNLTTGNHYYWIGATVKDDATLGAVIDLAVTGITYTCNSNETVLDLTSVGDPADRGAMVFNTQSYAFLPRDNGSRVYRIPAMVVADDGSIVVACDKRYDSHTDIGNGHIIDIVIRRSTDGGKTWGEPVVVAKGEGIVSGDGTRCGYGDPSLIKGNDGKIYCLFGAGNIGYFYGLNRICLSVSEDNGVTWSSSAANPPADLVSTGKVTDHANNYGGSNVAYGLYDYFVTSGRGLCTSEGYLMGLLPAQAYTTAAKSSDAKTGNSHDYVFYSTDGGATWHISEQPIFAGGDEAKVIQANDGSLIASVRQGGNRGFNTATYTKNEDGTLTFTLGTQYNNSQLNAGGYANNQDILYYQRETDEGKTDIIFHSMTVGQHANFKLYYSTDKGTNWTEFLTVQTKGTRYVTMERSANGSLYLFFEDQSLNSAGGYTDYNHYPLNFIEITRDQLAELIPELDEYQVPDFVGESKEVRVVYGTTGHTAYGTISGNTWTSNASSGVAGFTITKSDGSFNQFSSWNGHFNMAYAPGAANTASTLTLTAPDGYIITGYSLLAAKAYSAAHTYTLTAEDGTTITPSFATSSTDYTELSITGLSAASTTISITSTDASKYIAIADFVVTLANKPLALNVCGDASYATLYLPVDAQTDGNTKAYYITTTNNGFAQLIETPNEGTDIPAFTAVVLINDQAEAATPIVKTSGLISVVSQDDNLLKGTLVAKTLDLSDASPYYSLGKKNDAIGFYKYDNNGTTTITLGANRAYLDTTASSNSSKGFIFIYDDPTAIASILSGQSSANGQWYTLDGRKLNGVPTQRGIYINNGKKIVVK